MIKKVITFLGCVTLCFILYFAYTKVSAGGFDDSIKFIHQHFNGRGQLQDIQDEIGIESIGDVKWYDLGKSIEVEYGKVKLKVSKKDILTEEIHKKLQSVYIDYQYNQQTGEFKFFYRGQPITKYVK